MTKLEVGSHLPCDVTGESSFHSRELSDNQRLERTNLWRKKPERIHRYPSGIVNDAAGNLLYEYPEGTRLLMGEPEDEKEVMDSCQQPWVTATVEKAFQALLESKSNVNVLERGFGMGRIASEIMDYLRRQGGNYTVIELNEKVAEYAKNEWVNKQRGIDRERATSPLGGTYTGSNIEINIIEGDAYEETKKLAEEGRRFDIIVSDTFPLSEEERGINDLIDLETLKRCLAPGGVFTFFGYFTGSQGGIGSRQLALVLQHFKEYSVSEVEVNPPPDYNYFRAPTGPIRRLPVIICKRPKL